MLKNYIYPAVKGMRDVFPMEACCYQRLESRAHKLLACYGYGEIRTPLLEYARLFERGVGQGTDIVNKEMFFVPSKDLNGDGREENARRMVLRPEATASVVRAYIEHEMDKVSPGEQRYYYIGPMFRYERPQRGRLRQFTQIGVEVLGSALPVIDAEVIILLEDFLSSLGLQRLAFLLNAVGCPRCRPGYILKLQAYIQGCQSRLCGDCRLRLDKNPLRLFDCKQPACRELMARAPSIQDDLCADCAAHQAGVLNLLNRAGIKYQMDSRLMRGLDYYTRTVFEVTSSDLGAQNAVAAGGRYDNLVAELGGPPTPAIGWSLGMERILELLPPEPDKPGQLFDIYVVSPGSDTIQTFFKVIALRRQGLRVGLEHESRSVKAGLKRADRWGARWALWVTSENPEKVEVKNMATGAQISAGWEDLPGVVGK